MYVREYMQTKLVTVTPDTPIEDAEKLMNDFNIRRLPVLDEGKLVGLVTKHRMKRLEFVGPSIVRQIMVEDPITVTPDMMITDVALLGQQRKIGTFPVVDHDRLVGIMTATDIFNIQAQALGLGKAGLRLHIYDCCEERRLTSVIEIALSHKANILGFYQLTSPTTERRESVLFLDTVEGAELLNDLRAQGYVVEAKSE
jgi:acetoin utilization protein AcuB